MKKVLYYILMTLMMVSACSFNFISNVEAAEMIVLPVISKLDAPEIESTYFDNVLDCVKQQEKYNYLDGATIDNIIEKNTVKGQLPDEAALRRIAEEANADLVVAIELNKLDYSRTNVRTEDFYLMDVKGTTVSYDREQNKFEKRKIYVEDVLDNGYHIRQNVPLRYWARTVQHEMHRVMKFKGMGLQKQRLQRF